jgi:alcohol dehydrogenase
MSATGQRLANFKMSTDLFIGANASLNMEPVLRKVFSDDKQVMVVMDQGISKTAIASSICDTLTAAQLSFAVFDKISSNPTDQSVVHAFEFLKKEKCFALIAVGGGSSIDTAKAVGLLATNGGDLRDYYGNDKVKIPPLPLVAIPTTAGTGSEVSPTSMITDTSRKKIKFGIRSELNCPRAAILDPTLLRFLPSHIAAVCGMDALSHAIESFVSLWSNPFTEPLSLQAISLIGRNLKSFVEDPNNFQFASAVMYGSTMAGIAFSFARLGNVHCMVRPLEEKYPLSHGLACAALLPHVIRFNFSACPEKFRQIAQGMGLDVQGMNDDEAGKRLVERVQELNEDIGIPMLLKGIQARSEDVREMAKVCAETPYNQWNPRYTEEEDFRQIFEMALQV